jgi:DNA repair exonuclease SbcCD ATPase subunit
MLDQREVALREQAASLEAKSQELGALEKRLNTGLASIETRENALKERDQRVTDKEARLRAQEQRMDQRELALQASESVCCVSRCSGPIFTIFMLLGVQTLLINRGTVETQLSATAVSLKELQSRIAVERQELLTLREDVNERSSKLEEVSPFSSCFPDSQIVLFSWYLMGIVDGSSDVKTRASTTKFVRHPERQRIQA